MSDQQTRCCGAPCLTPTWRGKIYGHRCTNCDGFIPADVALRRVKKTKKGDSK